MSGICGVQTLDGSTPPALLLSALGRALLHRGPDGEARYSSGGTGILQTALAGEAAREDPGIVEAQGRVAVADGRMGLAELSAAVAACEPAADRISLTRDSFGMRPLYYAETPRGLIFASEPRAILASGLVERRLCPEALAELVQIQFTTGRHTLFSGIERVLPGETVIAERGKVVERRRMLNLPEGTAENLSESEALTRLSALMAGALEACTVPGETMGLLFDGRIEASALAAGLRAQGVRGMPFFALKAEGAGEGTCLAKRVAAACGSEAVQVEFGAKDFFALLPRVVACLDDPGADYAAVALYRLAQAAAERCAALITSAGGEVLFGGLGRYRSALRPLWLGGRAMRARGFMEGLGVLRDDPPAWRDGLRAVESRLAQRALTRLQIVQALDCALWLPYDVLPVLDRCLSAHSLGLRAPFLDPALATFAFTLPTAMKVAPGRGSVLLRRWLADVLPEAEPFARHRGPSLPVTRWIAAKAGALGPLVARNPGIMDLCAPGTVRRLYERLAVRPSKRLGHAAWQLLFFALWHRIHIEGKVPDGETCEILA